MRSAPRQTAEKAALTKKGSSAAATSRGVTVVGAGNWGTSLVSALLSAGVPVREIVVRGGAAGKAHKNFVPMTDANLDASILWICVPDAAISKVATQIVKRRPSLRGQIVVHSSGALTAAALKAAARAGAAVGSIHPVMSFPTRTPVPVDGVLFGVEAAPAVRRRLFTLVRSIGGQPFALSSEAKALYHAAGTLASPLLVSALSASVTTARAAGLSPVHSRHMVAALAATSMRNFFERGPERSFSGPFARGDSSTIDLHLLALKQHPILAGVYRALAEHALHSLPVRRRREIQQVLDAAGNAVRKKT